MFRRWGSMWWLAGVLPLLGALLTGCANDDSVIADPFTRQVRAEVAVNGQPVPGVQVTLLDGVQRSAVTDANGVALFRDIPDGTYRIAVTQFNQDQFLFNTQPLSFTISAANPQVVVRFPGIPATPGTVVPGTTARQVRATVTVSGQPVSGVRVALTGPVQRSELTDANGVVTFTNIPEGTYQIAVTEFDPNRFLFVTTPLTFTIDANTPQAVVELPGTPAANAAVTGRVTINGQTPFQLAGQPVTVTLVPPVGNPVSGTLTGTTGEFTFRQLVPGTYTLRVSHAGQVRATTLVVGPGQQLDLGQVEFSSLQAQ